MLNVDISDRDAATKIVALSGKLDTTTLVCLLCLIHDGQGGLCHSLNIGQNKQGEVVSGYLI